MAPLARSLDDLILDGLVEKIKRHRDADVLVDGAYNYNIDRDRTTPWQSLTAPLVNLEQDSDEGKNSDYVAKYHALCLVPVIGAEDKVALARLYVLKEQIKKALLDHNDHDLGQETGTIGKMSDPVWRRVQTDDDKLNEEILAGMWSFEIPYSYEAIDVVPGALDSISVKVGGLAALYQF